jgi:tripartite-type tricarboxylate transporter receptor subunit TctC
LGSLDKQTATCLVWHNVDINSIEDATRREVLVGATGTNATPAIFPSVLNALLGTKFKVISGYSTNEVRLAMERGETQGVCGLAWQTYKAIAPQWIADKKLKILAQMGLAKHKELPDVPLALDMFKNAADKKVFELVVLPQEFGRPFMAPPDLPADRAAALRKAFDEALVDPAFLADAAKIRLDIDAMTGDAIKAMLESAYAAPKDQIERAAKFSLVQ